MRKPLPRKTLIIGCALVVFFISSFKFVSLIRQRNNVINIPLDNNAYSLSEISPTRLEIPNLGIYLPITKANIKNGSWEYSDNSVSYLRATPVPGDMGNAILYGHNWPNLLGPLKQIKQDDLLKVHLSDGQIREFKVISTYVVTPDQTHILDQTEEAIVTLYTCTGFLDSKRLVVVLSPVTGN